MKLISLCKLRRNNGTRPCGTPRASTALADRAGSEPTDGGGSLAIQRDYRRSADRRGGRVPDRLRISGTALRAGRRRCGYVEPAAAASTRRSNVVDERSPGAEIGRADDAGQRSAHRDLTFCEPAPNSGLAGLRLTRPRHVEIHAPSTTDQSGRRPAKIGPRQNQTDSRTELQCLSSGRGP